MIVKWGFLFDFSIFVTLLGSMEYELDFVGRYVIQGIKVCCNFKMTYNRFEYNIYDKFSNFMILINLNKYT